ncbi:MAG: LpqB family beta-propeller domain-containing protein [Nocardioidaceae bacterium]
MTGRRRPVAGLIALLALALSGCVSLPEDGAVRSQTSTSQTDSDTLVDFTPGGPKPGSDPVPLVNNFLRAMTATPLSTYVAKQFLTSESSSSWVPEQGTVVYGGSTIEMLPGGRVELRLTDVVDLDDRGSWLGDRTRGAGRVYTLKLVKEGGDWRISDPPDRLIIPRTHFDTEYQQYFLYFFDKSAQVLVPEPVYVPRGVQAPTLLVAALLKGPAPSLSGVETTFVPRGTHLDGISSVPVSRDNTAEVPLSNEVLDLDDDQLDLFFAQLSWTLGQIAGVERMRVTVGRTPVDLAGGRVDIAVTQGSEFDPAPAWASTSLFAIRDRRVVTLTGNRESRISGPFGTLGLGLRSIAVDLPAQHVAGVTSDGTRVLESNKDRTAGKPATLSDVRTVYTEGTDLLKPAYDIYGQLVVVDRTPVGGRLAVVRAGDTRTVAAPGLTGEPVVRFVLSRDGTRLVSQIRRDGVDRLVVSRVERDAKGRVRALLPARPLPLTSFEGDQIRDLGWRTPGSLAVLSGPTAGTSQVLVVKIDGSSTPEDLSTDAELFRDQAVRLVTAPSVGAPLYIRTARGQLFSLAATGRWTGTSIEQGLDSPTFVG